MKANKYEFPNPVLASGRDDYIETCSFGTSFDEEKIVVDSENIVIPFSYELKCRGLQKLIDDKSAVVAISIKSPHASYSRLFKFAENERSILVKIPKYDVIEKIEITGMIISNCQIRQLDCDDELNPLYFASTQIDIRKGDFLAFEDSRVIYIDDSELEKPLASIFNINKVAQQDDTVLPDFSGDKIEINLKEELYEMYYHFKDFNNGSLRRYITGIIVYPVLVEAISKICAFYAGGTDVSDDKRWFRAIEKKCEKEKIILSDYQDSYASLADKLLGGISLDALKGFKDTLDSEMNNGETSLIGGVD